MMFSFLCLKRVQCKPLLTRYIGVNGQVGVSRVCPANGGSILTFEFRAWPNDATREPIDPTHKGPCAVYMKKVDSAVANNTAAGDGWWKVWDDFYDDSTGKWCTEKIIDNNGHLSVTIPQDIEGGYYLVRPEVLALQQAYSPGPADPQFYVGCAQIFLSSSGSNTPGNTVSIPGHVDMSNPAMTFNIYDQPMKLPYPKFGPPAYTSKSERGLEVLATEQTEGLKPANCVLENENWCGIELDRYSGQDACWKVCSMYMIPAWRTYILT